ncbi:hypothetical protein CC78DRAFT_510082 [Lojkania enalia]|uniref:DUF6594 domain-containing protein n=1 Tax=Lojkania enalia TaxID=147567 RepID=A0A9P4KIS2_9PLEO|nr:hypothetical protein CC78DRAFT_510082 [Didymosphaeria enalia]
MPLARRSRNSQKPKQWTKHQTPVITRRLNDSPKGYPNVAAFLDSDEGFTIYRRFGYLQSRLLLSKQEELRRLEVKLERLELIVSTKDENAFCSRDIRGEFAKEHAEVLNEIETKFHSYAKLLTTAQQMMAFTKPAEADRQNVGRYIWNRKPLVRVEASWIQHRDDLITIRAGREHAWLDGVVECILQACHCKLIDVIFRSKVQDNTPGTNPIHEIYYTPSRISKLTNGILTFMILALLVVPIYILYHMVHDIGTRKAYMTCIGTLLIFTLAFSSILSIFTKARRHEIFAAAAAYCAVLVVFLGNVGKDG